MSHFLVTIMPAPTKAPPYQEQNDEPAFNLEGSIPPGVVGLDFDNSTYNVELYMQDGQEMMSIDVTVPYLFDKDNENHASSTDGGSSSRGRDTGGNRSCDDSASAQQSADRGSSAPRGADGNGVAADPSIKKHTP